MKGQVSFEFLVVSAVFFGALAIWIPAVLHVQNTAYIALESRTGEIAADKLANTINSVYLLGDGNSQQVRLYVAGNATLSCGEGMLVMDTGEVKLERGVFPRKINLEQTIIAGSVTFVAENSDGDISITSRR
jgi:hypothetical protein